MAKIRDVKLETVCGITSRLPVNDRIEVAFAGKSNVGKSSLINSLVNRKGIARTSGQPGKTQTINYYHVNAGTPDSDTRLAEPFAPDAYLVDLGRRTAIPAWRNPLRRTPIWWTCPATASRTFRSPRRRSGGR